MNGEEDEDEEGRDEVGREEEEEDSDDGYDDLGDTDYEEGGDEGILDGVHSERHEAIAAWLTTLRRPTGMNMREFRSFKREAL